MGSDPRRTIFHQGGWIERGRDHGHDAVAKSAKGRVRSVSERTTRQILTTKIIVTQTQSNDVRRFTRRCARGQRLHPSQRPRADLQAACSPAFLPMSVSLAPDREPAGRKSRVRRHADSGFLQRPLAEMWVWLRAFASRAMFLRFPHGHDISNLKSRQAPPRFQQRRPFTPRSASAIPPHNGSPRHGSETVGRSRAR